MRQMFCSLQLSFFENIKTLNLVSTSAWLRSVDSPLRTFEMRLIVMTGGKMSPYMQILVQHIAYVILYLTYKNIP